MGNKFEPGDTVILKSGGPIMTISRYNDNTESYACQWFDGKKLMTESFLGDSLKLADANPDTGPIYTVGSFV